MKKLADITAKYIDQSFHKYTCMGFLHAIYTDFGIDVPDSFEDLSLDNYMYAYRRDPRNIQIKMLKLIRSLGKPSSTITPSIGDLLVVAQNTCRANVIPPGLFPAIYTGKGQALTSFRRTGVSMFALDKNHRPIVSRRLI